MAEQTERLCQGPCGERVGGEAGVHECQSAGEIVVGQIGIVLTQLQAGEHTLVDDGLAGERADIEVLVVDAALDLLSYYI